MPSQVTIYDVAAYAGVSISTVSQTVNRPNRVNAKTRERVLKAIEELQYMPKAQAVSHARRGVGRIGVLAPFTSYDSFRRRLMGVLAESDGGSRDVVVYDHESAAVSVSPLLRTLPVTGRLDGLLVMGLPLDDELAEQLIQRQLPTVLVDSSRPEFSTVNVDDDEGGAMLAQHLLERGHTSFAFVQEPQSSDAFLRTGPWPALVTLLPYRRDSVAGAALWPLLHAFAACGYAALVVDPRGMGSSDGPARPPFDPAETDDGVAAVVWAADQPWCTGAVGVWGFSYGALLALRVAARPARSLRAVLALMPLLDPERDYVHPGGAPGCLNAQGMWAMGTLTNALLPPLHEYQDPAEQRRWRERLAHVEPYLLDLHRHPPGDPVWRTRAVDVDAISVPVLCVGGTRDMFADATVRLYERVRGPRRLLLGPWSHSLPSDAPVHPVDLAAVAMRWWDRWLRDEPNGVETEPPVTVYVHNGDWLDLDELSPPGAPTRLDPDAPSHTDDPTVGPRGGLWGIPHGSGEPLDQHADDLRSVTFTGPPLAEPMLLLGRAQVALAGGPARLVVKLADVDPRGRSRLITGGIGTGTVLLDPTAYRVPAGHRLRVAISAGAFPRLWPAPAALAEVGPVTLALPVVPDSYGKPTVVPGVPARDRSGLWRRYEPLWEIRERPGHGVAVAIGEVFAATLPRAGVVVESRVRTTGTVHRGGSADLQGESRTLARLGTGERVVVEVGLRLTPDTVRLHGRVSIDGHVVADRRWRG